MSFAGPCFSSGSAHRPSQHGISWNEGSNLNNVLIALPQWIRVPARPLFILRPAKDIRPPLADLVIVVSPASSLYSTSRGRPPLVSSGTHYRQTIFYALRQPTCGQERQLLFAGPGVWRHSSPRPSAKTTSSRLSARPAPLHKAAFASSGRRTERRGLHDCPHRTDVGVGLARV